MIKANEAKKNVNEYQEKVFLETQEKVNEFVELMSESIEFHSKNGFDEITFTPYDFSRFSSVDMMEMASSIFQAILMTNGYEIVTNNWQKNILKVRW